MQAVNLLTLVILVGFLLKIEKSPYSRIIIGSVFGIMFLSIWPFTVYYVDIYKLSKTHLISSYVVISILAVIFSILLIRIKQQLAVGMVALLFFSTITIITLSFESKIKNEISIYTGYFNKINSVQNKVSRTDELSQRIIYTSPTYIVSLHSDWQKQTDKGPMFDYFLLIKSGKNIAEFRPKCSSTGRISLPEIVKNVNQLVQADDMTAKTNCYQIDSTTYACRIDAINKDKQTKRIRWFSLETESNHGIELDFVLFDSQPSLLNEIELAINSTKITKNTNADDNCLGLAEWM